VSHQDDYTFFQDLAEMRSDAAKFFSPALGYSLRAFYGKFLGFSPQMENMLMLMVKNIREPEPCQGGSSVWMLGF